MGMCNRKQSKAKLSKQKSGLPDKLKRVANLSVHWPMKPMTWMNALLKRIGKG